MLTAHGHEAIARHGRGDRALADAFLVKPVTASMLFDALVDARSANAQPLPSQRSPGRNAGSSQRLAGLRLLVAEDNANNQQVVRELLEDEGAVVQIAQDGQAAVDTLREGTESTFDAVLMDLQMPVMDGCTAARAIRQTLGMNTLPIVAMTANAMASDREACLAAGMNDHVAKPFDLEHLVNVLRRHADRPSAPEARALVVPTLLPAAVGEAAAAAGVDIDAALNRLGGKRDLYRRMLGNFTTDLAAMPAQLQAAQDDAPQAARLLHTLKGLAASLGDSSLAAEAARAEAQMAGVDAPAQARAAIEGAYNAVRNAAPRLATLLQALQAEPAFAAPAAREVASVDPVALSRALSTLAEHLRNADMAAADAMEALLLEFGTGPAAALSAMDEAITALDFDRALRMCNDLNGQPAAAPTEVERA